MCNFNMTLIMTDSECTSCEVLSGSLHSNLAAVWAIEHYPYCKIVGVVLEPVLDSGSHKQKVARLESVPLSIVEQNTSAANNDVDLVLRMRREFTRQHCGRKSKPHINRAAL